MTDLPTSGLAVDLSRLPAPSFVAPASFEEIRAARLADLQSRWPGFDALVESDPAVKLVEAGAYRELLLRGAINDVGRAVMLAHARGADLDNLAAGVGIARLTVTPATSGAPAILEADDDLRARVVLAPETFAIGGLTRGGYRALALAAAPSVADVAVIAGGAGRVDIVLLGRGDGIVSNAAIAAVAARLEADDVASITDIVAVRAADITTYDAAVMIRVRPGPDPALVRAGAEAAVRAYAAARFRIGLPVYAHMLAAAAAVGGVDQAIVELEDVDPGHYGAARLAQLAMSVEVLR